MARTPRQSHNNSSFTSKEIDWTEISHQFKPDLKNERTTQFIGSKREIETLQTTLSELARKEPCKQFILLSGPNFTGKTEIVISLVQKFKKDVNFFYLDPSWLIQKRFGCDETKLHSIVKEASDRQPALIFIDGIDFAAGKRRLQPHGEILFQTLKNILQNIHSACPNILVIAATREPDSLDTDIKLLYFRYEIQLKLPNIDDRAEFLKIETNLDGEEVMEIAHGCHCYTFNDLRELCKIKPITFEKLKQSMSVFKPAMTFSTVTPCPRVRWTDIGGSDSAKKQLIESLLLPLEDSSIEPVKGALMYGPSGCSKTMLAQALATESKHNFISIKGPELISKYVGDSEAAVRNLYRKAREIAPCLIFIDEIDSLAPKRSASSDQTSARYGVLSQLFTELDGVQPLEGVFTLAATNYIDKVDKALLRPGRLDEHIYVPLPSKEDRKKIFELYLKDKPISKSLTEMLANSTNGFSGAEIKKICRRAKTISRGEDKHLLEHEHFDRAIKEIDRKQKLKNKISFCLKSLRKLLSPTK